MRILIFTQKVDRNDDLLGFFHGWLREFAKNFEKVSVIGLGVGEYDLPKNVEVYSLGKEDGESKIKYVINFYKLIWKLRNEHDSVFVHMNREYMLLGGLFWKILGKKKYLWYNHQFGNFLSRWAIKLSDKVFHTSKFAFSANFSNSKIMPVGIDTELFKKDNGTNKKTNSILFLGRISPVKNVDVLINVVKKIDEKGKDFILNIVGDPGENNSKYFNKITKEAKILEQKGKIKFWGKAPNHETPRIYNENEVFVNLTNSGSFDKTTLESMACEKIAIVCNSMYRKIFPKEWQSEMIFREGDYNDLANKLTLLLNKSDEEKREIGKKSREIVVRDHSVNVLFRDLIKEMQ